MKVLSSIKKLSPELQTIITMIRDYAIKHHGDQMYGKKPYSYHLDRVASLFIPDLLNLYTKKQPLSQQFIDQLRCIEISYLHDILEDTEVTAEELNKEFHRETCEAVKLLTDVPGKNRKIRKKKTYAKIAAYTGPNSLIKVKLADRLANVRECAKTKNWGLLAMYKKEHGLFRTALFRNIPEARVMWLEIESIFLDNYSNYYKLVH